MTTFPIVYDIQARADLKQQFDYIHDQSGETRATEFIDRILAYVENLGVFPDMGRLLTLTPACIRAIAFRRQAYIVYAVQTKRLMVLRIFNKGRDVDGWLQLLLDEADE